MQIFFYPLFTILLISASCRSAEPNVYTVINGNLINLPDGILYVIGENLLPIDSTNTFNGRFNIKILFSDTNKNIYITFRHKSNSDDTTRLLSFKTNNKYNNKPLKRGEIVIGDTVTMLGKLYDYTPEVLRMQSILDLTVDSIIVGKQTRVLYNLDHDFSTSPFNSLKLFKELIKKHPYSFYLLHELKKETSRFSNNELQELLNLFDDDITHSYDAKIIKQTIIIREEGDRNLVQGHNKFMTLDGLEGSIIDEKAKINIVILWASWCGPCIAEMPVLKNLNSRYSQNNEIKMVSLSIDRNKSDWVKAVNLYNMPWSQLWISEGVENFKDIFKFDGSIPYTLFIDKNGKILKTISGFNNEDVDFYSNIIEKILADNNF